MATINRLQRFKTLGQMATIGRRAGVTSAFGFQFSGMGDVANGLPLQTAAFREKSARGARLDARRGDFAFPAHRVRPDS